MAKNLKDPAHVFETMALTIENPQDRRAYRSSCYGFAARVLAHNAREGNILDSDEIVLLGRRGQVDHAIVVRDGEAVIDLYSHRLADEGLRPTFNREAGLYRAPLDPKWSGENQLEVIESLTVAAFKARYPQAAAAMAPKNAEGPAPGAGHNPPPKPSEP